MLVFGKEVVYGFIGSYKGFLWDFIVLIIGVELWENGDKKFVYECF